MSTSTKKRVNRGVSSGNPLGNSARVFVVAFFWIILFALILGRLVEVQVVEHAKFSKVRERYFKNRRTIPAKRGTILDRNGKILAEDLIHYSLAIRPKELKPFNTSIKSISSIIDVPVSKIKTRLAGKHRFVYVARRLSPETARRIRKLRLSGVVLEKKISRYYPYRSVGAQVIGYCDFENKPCAGLEIKFNHFLQGKPGWMVFSRDALGNQIPNLDFPMVEPIDGMNLVTTIDIVYQGVVEEELSQAVKKHQARSGSAILLDARSGEVLAMANYPGFDPNHYNQYPIANFRNSAISDVYEPGSTFKIIALALAVEQLKMDLNRELVYCENGSYQLYGNVIHDHKKFGYLTARKVFEESSNIGVMKIARKFSPAIFYRYARDFGFGNVLGIDLPAESPGILHRPDRFTAASLSYMSIGYEVAVTPLQLAAAYGAVANNGLLMRPYLLQKVADQAGNAVLSTKPESIRQVISPLTASIMRKTLTGVVREGTGRSAFIEGMGIAGKTGTAQLIDAKTNRYSSKQHVASFVGFFPVESPRFVLLVVVNSPRNGYYGSQVAAPTFKNIARRIVGLPSYGLAMVSTENNYFREPDTKTISGETVNVKAKLKKSNTRSAGKPKKKTKKGRSKPSGVQQTVPVRRVKNVLAKRPARVMPKLEGLTLKEALQVLGKMEKSADVVGYGVVVQQLPVAGRVIDDNSKIKLICRPT